MYRFDHIIDDDRNYIPWYPPSSVGINSAPLNKFMNLVMITPLLYSSKLIVNIDLGTSIKKDAYYFLDF